MTRLAVQVEPVQPRASAPAGISSEQMQAITEARERSRKIRRAAAVAQVSGWSLAFFAFVTILTGLWSIRALLLGLGLAVIAIVELRGARGLRGFDRSTPRRLALNQAGLVVAVFVYAIWGIHEAVTGPGAYADQLAAGGQVAEMLQPIDALTRAVSIGVCVALMIGSAVAQGCTALYYLTRRRHLERVLRETPAWVLETIRV